MTEQELTAAAMDDFDDSDECRDAAFEWVINEGFTHFASSDAYERAFEDWMDSQYA